jgi:putative acetyltransferase
MIIMQVKIRSEEPSDVAAIESLTAAAFLNAPHTGHNEHLIVNALREASDLTISLVADDDGDVIGHVALSPVSISDGSVGWYGLGPISVLPERQRQGIGSRLMERALEELRGLGASGCVVLGDPSYYGRFGFKVESALVLRGVSPEYFQAIVLRDTSPSPSGVVSYARAFNV